MRLRGPSPLILALLPLAWASIGAGNARVAVAAPVVAAADPIQRQIDAARETMLTDPQATVGKTIAIERSIARLPPHAGARAELAAARWLRGEAYLRLGKVDRARPLIDDALRMVDTRTPTRLAGDLLLSRGWIDSLNANVAAALVDYQRAFEIFRAIGEPRGQAQALVSLGALYNDANDNQSALKYYRQAAELYRADRKLLVSVYNNMGQVLKSMGQLREARQQFKAALLIADQLHSKPLSSLILRNIARAELDAGALADAERTIRRALPVSQAVGAQQVALVWSLAAQLELQRGNLPRARALIMRTFAQSGDQSPPLAFAEAHKTAYQIFSRMGDAAAALRHLEAQKRLDDETAQLAASANTALLAARFDYANQNLKIAMLKRAEAQRSLELERSRAAFQRTILWGVVVATLITVSLLVFGLITIGRSRNAVRAANIDLGETNRALQKALAAKTEFLATTSHEIRTPLNGILGMTEVMLADQALPTIARDRVALVHGAGMTMRALIDDILDVAKMETGHLTLESAPFDLKRTLMEVAGLCEAQARCKGLAFETDLSACPTMVIGDAARLRQIAFNLLSNALKFTLSGSVTLRAWASDDGIVMITVRDTGIGIPADKRQVIFDSFRQVDAGTTRRFGGTGLGLAICRNLAEAMGGAIDVDSVEGEGSTFTVWLPLSAAPAPPADARQGELLIIDRNPITRRMLRALCEPQAPTAAIAASIDEALALIDEGGVATVLIDQSAVDAEEAGEAAMRRLRAKAAAGATRIVLLWAAPDDAARARIAGWEVDTLLAKPIAGAALIAALFPSDAMATPTESAPHLVSDAA